MAATEPQNYRETWTTYSTDHLFDLFNIKPDQRPTSMIGTNQLAGDSSISTHESSILIIFHINHPGLSRQSNHTTVRIDRPIDRAETPLGV